MGEKTGIEWSDATWNPWYGCRKVSPACAHCYAEREMTRYGRNFNTVTRAKDATFYAPLKWKEPRMVFTCSWSDFFIEEADAWRDDAWGVIDETPEHTYQVLSKRPERFAGRMPPISRSMAEEFPNVWLGVSAENQHFADKRIPLLMQTPAAIRFISVEPLLGPLDLGGFLGRNVLGENDALRGLDWVIVGGESGEGFRPLNMDWVRSIRDQCIENGVAFFFKQKSALRPKSVDRILDGREWSEFPVSSTSTGY